MAEEDRENLAEDAPLQEMPKDEEIRDKETCEDELPESLPESFLQSTDNEENVPAPGGEEKVEAAADAELTEDVDLLIAEHDLMQDDTEQSSQKDEGVSILEPDQPECDINSTVENAKDGQGTSQNESPEGPKVTLSLESAGSHTANSGGLAVVGIPRVGSQGSIGHIHNSVQALIDKTSGFLDSDPPSTVSSMSDLDQAGLDALSSSSRVFESIKLETPSPIASSPQHASSHPGQTSHKQQSETLPHQQQVITSRDSSSFPADNQVSTPHATSKNVSVPSPDTEEDLLSQLDAELDSNKLSLQASANSENVDAKGPNGLMQRTACLSQLPEYKSLLCEWEALRKQTDEQQQRIKR